MLIIFLLCFIMLFHFLRKEEQIQCKVCNDTKKIEVLVMGTDTSIVECSYCNKPIKATLL